MSHALWERYKQRYRVYESIGLSLDVSRVDYTADFVEKLRPRFARAFAAMAAIERGEIANVDEKRMVGHYWLRNSELAPTPILQKEIEDTI